jgi:molybdopterin molybdotransferase
MLSEEEARSLVLGEAHPLSTERVPLETALGAVLAEEVTSDIDMPPFDRAAMDGYAVRLADVATTPVELIVLEQIKAGDVPKRTVAPGEASGIMTGAPVPAGADAVVPVEQTEPAAGGRVRIVSGLAGKTNVAHQGEDLRQGDVVLEAGRLLGSAHVGLLAMVGRCEAVVHRRPLVAVLATGDELVEPHERPRPGQTRNSNNASLLAECGRAGFPAVSLGIARDRRPELDTAIRTGLRYDVLLVSGGVSMGEYDLVPEVLAALGAEVHFDQVAIKPGKPTVFATAPLAAWAAGEASSLRSTNSGRRLVFGLPGNPVSVIVVFRLLVEPALRRLAGRTDVGPQKVPVVLQGPARNREGRRAYQLARLHHTAEGLLAEPLPSHGSADLMALTRADALIQLEAGCGEVPAGSRLPALLLGS